MPVRFVGIMEDKNRPVYFKSFDRVHEDRGVNQQFIAEMSLDYIEGLAHAAASDAVGLLLVHDGIAVYGALANTGAITLVGVDAYSPKQLPIENLVHRLQDSYVHYMSNPFYDETKSMNSNVRYNTKVENLFAEYVEAYEEIAV